MKLATSIINKPLLDIFNIENAISLQLLSHSYQVDIQQLSAKTN